jgi:ribosome-associated toxin RatA of RatAB toxin-antitoxin module
MTQINRSALLPYPAREVYKLVNDIEQYPQFMDGCVGAEVLSAKDDIIEARLDLAKAGISHSFTTRNVLAEPESIRMELVDGPFDYFSGSWQFQALGESACKVSLEMDFSFSSKLLGVAGARLFEVVSNNLVDALCKRAAKMLEEA